MRATSRRCRVTRYVSPASTSSSMSVGYLTQLRDGDGFHGKSVPRYLLLSTF